MTAVFYKTALVMNTSEDGNDVSYLTAAQQSSGRGYLMYECMVESAKPGSETASAYLSKPGYFGRPWLATTSEVVFYNTLITTTDFPGSEDKSLILPLGWLNSLGGESALMYEYGTNEMSGVDNSANRAAWSTLLANPSLTDNTNITTFNFTKGGDDWDPIPGITDGTQIHRKISNVSVRAFGNRVFVSNINSDTLVSIYTINGALTRSFKANSDMEFTLDAGLWIVKANSADGQGVFKIVTH